MYASRSERTRQRFQSDRFGFVWFGVWILFSYLFFDHPKNCYIILCKTLITTLSLLKIRHYWLKSIFE